MSLFGHLALKFGSHPENLATEGLAYVLRRSARARAAFVSSLAGAAGMGWGDLHFETQHSTDDQGRPDLVGLDGGGNVRVLVEAKFWAGFTEHQPVHYLDHLPDGGALMVICPHARLTHVWRELRARVQAAGRTFEESAAPGEIGRAVVGSKHLVLQSWGRALGAIRLELSHEPELLADVGQL